MRRNSERIIKSDYNFADYFSPQNMHLALSASLPFCRERALNLPWQRRPNGEMTLHVNFTSAAVDCDFSNDFTANPRSRTSKRASSPSINLDKSLKNAPRQEDARPLLAVQPNSGVRKLVKRVGKSRKQKLRQQKGSARAEAVLNQLGKKVEEVGNRDEMRKERKRTWDEVNTKSKRQRRANLNLERLAQAEQGKANEGAGVEDEVDAGDVAVDGVDVGVTPVPQRDGESFVLADSAASTIVSDSEQEIT